jgi:hypothetical protein
MTKARAALLKQIAEECTDECLACLDNRSQGFVHNPDRALFARANRAGNSGDTAVFRKKG